MWSFPSFKPHAFHTPWKELFPSVWVARRRDGRNGSLWMLRTRRVLYYQTLVTPRKHGSKHADFGKLNEHEKKTETSCKKKHNFPIHVYAWRCLLPKGSNHATLCVLTLFFSCSCKAGQFDMEAMLQRPPHTETIQSLCTMIFMNISNHSLISKDKYP